MHAIATVTFEVDHIVSGVAINILGLGRPASCPRSCSPPTREEASRSRRSCPATSARSPSPCLSGGRLFGWRSPDILGSLEDKRWFFVSRRRRRAPRAHGNLSYLTIIAVALVPFSWWLLWRTRIRFAPSVGRREPERRRVSGVPVYTMKYIAVTISGALAGLAGAFLSLVSTSLYKEGQTANRGFIGLAAMIFGNWRPAALPPAPDCSASLTRFSCAATTPCTASCCSSASSLVSSRSSRSGGERCCGPGCCPRWPLASSSGTSPPTGSARVRLLHALRGHPRRARVREPAAATAGGRRLRYRKGQIT